MILKKPYAFLIKNFKIIHIILSIVILSIRFLFKSINSFFSSYIKGNVIGSIGLSSTYINPILYLLLVTVTIFSLVMFLLMRKKEKPTLFYILAFIYYIILLIMVIVAASVMNSIESASLTQQSSRAYRDIYLILSLPQYYFLIMSIIRGIGFDVKKFNFNKDLEELEIKSEDNEEFEFVLGTDTYIYQRKIRRTLRELKYYILENKLIFTWVISGIAIFVIGFLVINFNILNKVYKVGSSGTIGNLDYKLLKAYETRYDYNGKLISKENKYLVLDLIITNKTSISQTIDNTSIYLKAGGQSFYNKPSLRNYFIDIGKSYTSDAISEKNTSRQILIFELDNSVKYNKYFLNILKSIDIKKGETVYDYSQFKINPERLNTPSSVVDRKINEVMYLGNNIFDDSNITIKSAEIRNSYEYKYESCEESVCNEYYDIVTPNNPATESLLILNYKLIIKEDIGLNENMSNSTKYFFDKFLKIEYNYNGKRLIRDINSKSINKLNDWVFIAIPKTAVRSDVLNLVVSTRNNDYSINLKNI